MGCKTGEAQRAAVVIAGAGIAGVSVGYHLSAELGVDEVVLVDPLPPLTLTSDKSTECYRNWWPGPGSAMVELMNRSIDLLEAWSEASGDIFHLSRRGYLYTTADPSRLAKMKRHAEDVSSLGAGSLRIHRGGVDDPPYTPSPATGFLGAPDGADLFLDGKTVRRYFPYLSEATVGGLHARRAGWFSAQQLGVWLLDSARKAGMELIADRVASVQTRKDQIQAVTLGSGRTIRTTRFVNAAGPLIGEVARSAGYALPVYSEVHRKIAFRDSGNALPRSAPMMIWNDPQRLAWSSEERIALGEDAALRHLVGELGAGAHCRPEGPDDAATVLGLWEYRTEVSPPRFPIADDALYPEVTLRGLATMVPAFDRYLAHLPKAFVDGGYYTKTRENRPLIGPAGPAGSYVVGALSGFGVMAAAAAGELGALHVCGADLPGYARWFDPNRYSDPEYLDVLGKMTDSGQI